MAENYSESYRQQLSNALISSKKLNYLNQIIIKPYPKISNKKLENLQNIIYQKILPILWQSVGDKYKGTSCIDLSINLFIWLQALGYESDIVYGEVEINGVNEFDVSIEELFYEYNNRVAEGIQNIHAWVTIGDDIIIDMALPDRILKFYGVLDLPPIFINRAGEMSRQFRSKYKPMLVGTDFIAKTNSIDPREAIQDLKSLLKIEH
ncbi:hypothetical protein [Acinetobacter sp. CFCC 10889]|uniref:hypothetical protein n=1 Tax=Acinetobacter sp. CFCC 10889 TaxID=1775557 RepID=UPI000DCFDD5C|nr:hypothetical protein [Acinetobacter sp. CFCC 10889]